MDTSDVFDIIAPTLIEQKHFDPTQTLFQIMISADSARRDGFDATADALLEVARLLGDVAPPSTTAAVGPHKKRRKAKEASILNFVKTSFTLQAQHVKTNPS